MFHHEVLLYGCVWLCLCMYMYVDVMQAISILKHIAEILA